MGYGAAAFFHNWGYVLFFGTLSLCGLLIWLVTQNKPFTLFLTLPIYVLTSLFILNTHLWWRIAPICTVIPVTGVLLWSLLSTKTEKQVTET
jgi:hypothetical protein